jgi:hypothetical protein
VPGVSTQVKRVHAPDQPAGFSGHHSIGGVVEDPPDAQIP